jgi:peptidoglycan/LPS O-acetylase OafA/YrhL
MSRSFSVYLDLVRIVSALMVVLYHSTCACSARPPFHCSNHGHAAVIVFFVLSGYVIAHITATRNTPRNTGPAGWRASIRSRCRPSC